MSAQPETKADQGTRKTAPHRGAGYAIVQEPPSGTATRCAQWRYLAPRWDAVFRVTWSDSVSVPHQVGRTLWGRASSLPVRGVEVGRAFPRECGVLGVVDSWLAFRTLPSTPAFWVAVTLWRPSDPASHHRRGHSWVDLEGCDHADGTPAACLVAGTADRIALPGGARHRPCAGRNTPPWRSSGTKPCPAPRWGAVFRVPWSASVSGWADIVGAGFQPARQGC